MIYQTVAVALVIAAANAELYTPIESHQVYSLFYF